MPLSSNEKRVTPYVKRWRGAAFTVAVEAVGRAADLHSDGKGADVEKLQTAATTPIVPAPNVAGFPCRGWHPLASA
ncbi:hypothetical protein [Pseudomonas schmalbachii]|uniref:Uncharacterized protein n=1 Tax=Pseudomonas schmalbachii TaxID=2816993 RepID=A0ABS3TPE6_9PSED|nr:hypothetical protein [Pseudomonas schmalbachii]MBO3275531.1 hypothetical protein [Pseudomonas schmalbachii]